MSRFRRYELIQPSYSSVFTTKSLSCFPSFALEEVDDDLDILDILDPAPLSSPFDIFDALTPKTLDVTEVEHTPYSSTFRRVQRRVNPAELLYLNRVYPSELLYLKSLSDRVSLLESSFERLAKGRNVPVFPPLKAPTAAGPDRKYKISAEFDGVDRKYQWTTEIKGDKKKKHLEGGKNYKWTAEIEKKSDGTPILKNYTIKVSSDKLEKEDKKDKKKEDKGDKKKKHATRTLEIQEIDDDHRVVAFRQAHAKRAILIRKGKKKELPPQDAAVIIQMNYRSYLVRRSQALRSLRDLAIARTKLKEIRKLFNNCSYRRRILHDAEEHQKFSERIIVLLLTVDAMEGTDRMVRKAKKSMVDELEAMLDVVDPQPAGSSLSMKRRTFDLPNIGIQQEIAAGVAQVVHMINQEENKAINLLDGHARRL